MRWQSKQFLVFLLFIFCLFTFFSTDNYSTRSRGVRNEKYRERDFVHFTQLSKLAQVVFGMRDLRDGNMGHPSARFLVISQQNLRFHCRFPSGIEAVGQVYSFSENHNMPYGIYYVACEIPKDELFFKHVEVSEESTANWVQIPIEHTVPDDRGVLEYKFDYGICVPMFYGTKYSAKSLIEFMELNSLLGAERVTIYTSGKPLEYDLQQVFDYYANLGMLQEIEMVIPDNFTQLWYHGQLAAISDCLVRHTALAKYVAFHDLDEYLIPMQKTNVVDVLKKKLNGNVASLRVPTRYLSSELEVKDGLITLQDFNHGPIPDKTFTKCVLRPEMVFEQGIHHTSRVIQDIYGSPHASIDDLMLYHFKKRGSGQSNTRIRDIYGQQLEENFNLVVKYLRL